ncbi:MAG: hypothetical protein FWD06_08255 [Oscillospiraceae bacterium]|nr:hypothetical protein [Oscillospiraceae bacterium]
MMKVVLILIALILLLAACGIAEGTIDEANGTTAVEAIIITEVITEYTTTQPPFDPNDLMREIALCEANTVFERTTCPFALSREVWLRNELTGAEELLLGAEEIHTTFNDAPYSYFRYAALRYRINERFFVYSRFVPESCYNTNIRFFDVQQRRSIHIQLPDYGYHSILMRVEDDRIYFANGLIYGSWPDEDEFFLHALDISVLESGQSPLVLQPIGMISREEVYAYYHALVDFHVPR